MDTLYVEYKKVVKDSATMLEYPTAMWGMELTGTFGRDSNNILSSMALLSDKFIDEYLRVNADACK